MPNESLIHADVFFLISTIALVIISIGMGVALFYAIKILRNIKDVTDMLRDESQEIISDVKLLRKNLRDEGLKWKHVIDLVRNFFVRSGKTAENKVEKIAKKVGKIIK
jgi:hypothetical protein